MDQRKAIKFFLLKYNFPYIIRKKYAFINATPMCIKEENTLTKVCEWAHIYFHFQLLHFCVFHYCTTICFAICLSCMIVCCIFFGYDIKNVKYSSLVYSLFQRGLTLQTILVIYFFT